MCASFSQVRAWLGTQRNSRPGGTPWPWVHILHRHPTPGPDSLFPEPPRLHAGLLLKESQGLAQNLVLQNDRSWERRWNSEWKRSKQLRADREEMEVSWEAKMPSKNLKVDWRLLSWLGSHDICVVFKIRSGNKLDEHDGSSRLGNYGQNYALNSWSPGTALYWACSISTTSISLTEFFSSSRLLSGFSIYAPAPSQTHWWAGSCRGRAFDSSDLWIFSNHG